MALGVFGIGVRQGGPVFPHSSLTLVRKPGAVGPSHPQVGMGSRTQGPPAWLLSSRALHLSRDWGTQGDLRGERIAQPGNGEGQRWAGHCAVSIPRQMASAWHKWHLALERNVKLLSEVLVCHTLLRSQPEEGWASTGLARSRLVDSPWGSMLAPSQMLRISVLEASGVLLYIIPHLRLCS